MMNQTAHYALVARQGYRAIRLPYVVRALGMVVVLPNEIDGLGDVVRSIDTKEQSEMLAGLRGAQSRPVVLALPRFKIESTIDLIPQFQQAGMKLAFDRDRADFSGVTGPPVSEVRRLYISQISHRAMVEVAEESTEAAAATAVILAAPGGSSPPPGPPPEVFRVDRPFLFYIVDNGTGAILFAGRISSPPQVSGPAVTHAPAVLPSATVGPAQARQPSSAVT